MENLNEQFQDALITVKSKSQVSNDDLLKLYALYKQATSGDNDTPVPSNPFDFVSKAKHEAWLQLQGLTKEKAMEQYVALVNNL